MPPSLRTKSNALRVRTIGWLPARWRAVFLFPPGHFYSPLTDFTRFDPATGPMAGDDESAWENIDPNAGGQRKTYQDLLEGTRHLPLPVGATAQFRYDTRNDMFAYGDAFLQSGLLQQARPRRIVEIGSDFSCAVMLDTADACGLETRFTSIEIRPDRRPQRLLRPRDGDRVTVDVRPVQDVAPAFFETIESGDLLSIDSSQVAKVGSDVSDLLMRVPPRLRRGCARAHPRHFRSRVFPVTLAVAGPRMERVPGRARVFSPQLCVPDMRLQRLCGEGIPRDVRRTPLPIPGESGRRLWLEKVR